MKLISENVEGNTHEVVVWANKWQVAKYVLQIHTGPSGANSVVVLLVPDEFDLQAHALSLIQHGKVAHG